MAFMGLCDVNEVADMCGRQHAEQTKIVTKAVEDIKPNIDYSNKFIIVVNDSFPKTYAGLIASKLSDNHPIIIGSIEKLFIQKGLSISDKLVIKGNPSEMILDYIKNHQISLVITEMGKLKNRIINNSVNRLVLEYCECDILINKNK